MCDKVRAIAVMLVMIFHSSVPLFHGGFLGVDVFFVLSGYLITRILLAELDKTGNIQLLRFYIHRLARLSPPLLLLLLLYLVAAPHFWPDYSWHVRDSLLTAMYLTDYAKALYNVPDMLRHTWSLSVEEHFYLLWPLGLMLLSPVSKRQLPVILFT